MAKELVGPVKPIVTVVPLAVSPVIVGGGIRVTCATATVVFVFGPGGDHTRHTLRVVEAA